jgi:RHH-type rel operon transcriptional repressor/antitoxin RelB
MLFHALDFFERAHMISIRLPKAIEKRLEKLARRTGRTKSFYVRQAILQNLDDYEDVYLAERVLERIRSGKEKTIPFEEVLKHYGLED